VRVPEVLRKYIPGAPEKIPYVKELPKDSTSQKAKSTAPGSEKGSATAREMGKEATSTIEKTVNDVTEKVKSLTSQ